jgi:hypothetical protein
MVNELKELNKKSNSTNGGMNKLDLFFINLQNEPPNLAHPALIYFL